MILPHRGWGMDDWVADWVVEGQCTNDWVGWWVGGWMDGRTDELKDGRWQLHMLPMSKTPQSHQRLQGGRKSSSRSQKLHA